MNENEKVFIRPVPNNYQTRRMYCGALEKYVDELELEYQSTLKTELKYAKALDKACEYLEIFVKSMPTKSYVITKEHWKEWLLSEVSK